MNKSKSLKPFACCADGNCRVVVAVAPRGRISGAPRECSNRVEVEGVNGMKLPSVSVWSMVNPAGASWKLSRFGVLNLDGETLFTTSQAVVSRDRLLPESTWLSPVSAFEKALS